MFNVCQNMKDHLRVNHFLRSPSVRDIGSNKPEQVLVKSSMPSHRVGAN